MSYCLEINMNKIQQEKWLELYCEMWDITTDRLVRAQLAILLKVFCESEGYAVNSADDLLYEITKGDEND